MGSVPRRHEPHISLVLAPRAKPIALSSAAPLMPRSGHVVADLQLTRCLTVGRTGDQRPVGHDRRPRWSWPMTGGPGGTGVRARQTSQAPGDSRSSFAGALSGRGRRVFVPAGRRPRTTTLCPHHDNPALPVAPTASTADGPVTTAERGQDGPVCPSPGPGRRPLYVRAQPETAGLTGTRWDAIARKATAREAGKTPVTCCFRWWWQVLGSNQRRLSRRFYRPLVPLAHMQPDLLLSGRAPLRDLACPLYVRVRQDLAG